MTESANPAQAFAAGAGARLQQVAGQVSAVKQAAESGQLRFDEQSAGRLLDELEGIRWRVRKLVESATTLDTPLRFGDNWVGRAVSERLRDAAAGRQHAAIPVLEAFDEVIRTFEFTVRAAAEGYVATDEQTAAELIRTGEALAAEEGER